MRPFRFGIISDPHLTLPHTLYDVANRFHLVEVSIPAFEQILARFESLDLDFLLLPGDLTQHGERENHQWLIDRLGQLPLPTYVVPGNHDVITRDGCDRTLSLAEFPQWYEAQGYENGDRPYYCCPLLPGVRLIGLNSIAFDDQGQQLPYGYLSAEQLDWLETLLARPSDDLTLVMVHHNLLDHLPGQHRHPLGRRYSIKNREALLTLLQRARVPLVLTGHLHVQDVALEPTGPAPLWEVTTGSLVSYPHPYRVVTVAPHGEGGVAVEIESDRVTAVPDWPDLGGASRQWMGDRAFPFMVRLLMGPPFHLAEAEAAQYAPHLRDFWATVAAGDGCCDYPDLPLNLREPLRRFGAVDSQGRPCHRDNGTVLRLHP